MKHTPLVFLPGAVCDHRLFEMQTRFFSDNRDVVIADFSGHDSINSMAQSVLKLVPEHFALVGLSMGGIVAFEVLRQAAERVERLALLDTNPYPDGVEQKLLRNEQIELVASGGVDGLLSVLNQQLMPRYIAPGNPDSDKLKALIKKMTLDLGPDVFVRHWTALAKRVDSTSTLAKIKCPTLVLCGSDDACVHRLCIVIWRQKSTIPGMSLCRIVAI